MKAFSKRGRRGRRAKLNTLTIVLVVYFLFRPIMPTPVVRLIPRVMKVLRTNMVDWSGRLVVAQNKAKSRLLSAEHIKIYVISLMHANLSVPRAEQTLLSLKQQDLEYVLFPAVNGLAALDLLDVQRFAGVKKKKALMQTLHIQPEKLRQATVDYRKNTLPSRMRKLIHERLRFGCYMSHVKLWEYMVQTGQRFAIVLEDDVTVVDGFMDKLLVHINRLPEDWDIFYLDGCFQRPAGRYAEGIWLLRGSLCTRGYVISRSAAAQLALSYALNSEKAVDHMIDENIYSGQLLAFQAVPALVGSTGSRSTLLY